VADHTVVNLREIEDSAVKFGYAPDLAAHFATGELGLEKSGVSLQRLAPDKRAPFGHRDRQEELYVVLSGGGRVKIDDEIVELRQWDAVRVAPGAARQFEAGPEGIELLAFGAPRSGGGDAEMLGEWWTD
jgi:mannose-6-phosphate isomerase-like protein (cupin superfamily)